MIVDPKVATFRQASKTKKILWYKHNRQIILTPVQHAFLRHIIENPFTSDQFQIDEVTSSMCKMFGVPAKKSMRLNVLLDGFFVTDKDRSVHIIMTIPEKHTTASPAYVFTGRFQYFNLQPHDSTRIITLMMQQ